MSKLKTKHSDSTALENGSSLERTLQWNGKADSLNERLASKKITKKQLAKIKEIETQKELEREKKKKKRMT